jgi:hypothetical protein
MQNVNQPRQPPPGVESVPQGHVVSLQEAAAWLGKERRTLIRWIVAGRIRGGATPRAQRLRWYVYADELANYWAPSTTATTPDADSDGLRSQIEDLRAQAEGLRSQVEDLRRQDEEARSQNVSLKEANGILIAAQQNLLDTEQGSVDRYRDLARSYLDALAQFMSPGTIAELGADL